MAMASREALGVCLAPAMWLPVRATKLLPRTEAGLGASYGSAERMARWRERIQVRAWGGGGQAVRVSGFEVWN